MAQCKAVWTGQHEANCLTAYQEKYAFLFMLSWIVQPLLGFLLYLPSEAINLRVKAVFFFFLRAWQQSTRTFFSSWKIFDWGETPVNNTCRPCVRTDYWDSKLWWWREQPYGCWMHECFTTNLLAYDRFLIGRVKNHLFFPKKDQEEHGSAWNQWWVLLLTKIMQKRLSLLIN